MNYMGRYYAWLHDPLLDEDLRRELLAIRQDDQEIKNRFYDDIDFGTAGLRGEIGAGSMLMNTYNIKLASEALSRVLLENRQAVQGVVIACDSRHRSQDFAREAALVFCGNGIPVYLFSEITPVPILSYAIRHLNCAAGITVTASHNPPQYNGYKAYAAYGGQLPPADCAAVLSYMRRLSSLADVAYMTEEAALRTGRLHYVGKDVLASYYKEALQGILSPEAIQQNADLPIAYTPLFGAGNHPVRELLKQAGLHNVKVVKEQERPNGDFPGLKAPNPEEDDALRLVIRDAKKQGAALALATDPDSDRLAIAIPQNGEYHKLTGNQAACLLLYYRLSRMKELGLLPKNGLILRSIVSTSLADRIAAGFGLAVTEVLTGFRYVSQQIDLHAEKGIPLVFAFEESYGYLCVDLSRDKDAVSSALYLCEAACYYRSQGKSLMDVMTEIYETYGYQEERADTLPFPGPDGLHEMAAIMAQAREELPEAIAGKRVLAVRDYQASVRATGGVQEPLAYPKSNVVFYELEGGSWACLRPSGTDPKLKVYASAAGATQEEAHALLDAILLDRKDWISR